MVAKFVDQNNRELTAFIRLNAAAFIKTLAFPMRRLFKGGVYFETTFFKITDNSYCKSFVNVMKFKGSNVSLHCIAETESNSKCLNGVNLYQVVPKFFLLSPSKSRILLITEVLRLFKGGVSNFASICGV